MENNNKYKQCLIIVDMVNGFITEGVLHDPNISKIIPRQIELINEYEEKDNLIIFIKDTHTENSVEFVRFGNTVHCLENTKESELVEELKKFEHQKNTIVIEKNSTSFMEAPKFRQLMEQEDEIEKFDIVGCCTDICVVNGTIGLANYLDQQNRPHEIFVHEDAIATYNELERQEYVEAAKILMTQQGIQLVEKRR